MLTKNSTHKKCAKKTAQLSTQGTSVEKTTLRFAQLSSSRSAVLQSVVHSTQWSILSNSSTSLKHENIIGVEKMPHRMDVTKQLYLREKL